MAARTGMPSSALEIPKQSGRMMNAADARSTSDIGGGRALRARKAAIVRFLLTHSSRSRYGDHTPRTVAVHEQPVLERGTSTPVISNPPVAALRHEAVKGAAPRRHRVLMLNPTHGFSGLFVRHIPLSLLYASAELVKNGIEVEILDNRLDPRRVREAPPAQL